MSPIEKAESLIKSFYPYSDVDKDGVATYYSKQCVIITVDEVIESIYQIIGTQPYMWSEHQKEQIEYWQQVKKIITEMK